MNINDLDRADQLARECIERAQGAGPLLAMMREAWPELMERILTDFKDYSPELRRDTTAALMRCAKGEDPREVFGALVETWKAKEEAAHQAAALAMREEAFRARQAALKGAP